MQVESAEGEPAKTAAEAGAAAGDRRAHGLAALLLAGMAALMAADIAHDSPTMDEKNHVLRGLAIYRSGGDTRLSSAHPPLANLAQALPGALAGPGFDPREAKSWARADINGSARAYLGHDYARARRDIMGGRWVTLAITLAFGGFLYRWGLGRGRIFALALLGLYCAHPIVLAHGHLATTDLPFTAAYFVAIVALGRYLERGGVRPLLGLAAALALAFVVKFSAVLLLPPLAIGGAYGALRGLGRFAGRGLGRRLGLLIRDGAALGLAVLLAINAVYGFQGTGMRAASMMARQEPIHPATGGYRGRLLEERSPIRHLQPWVPVPLPYTYVFGLAAVQAKTQDGHGLHIFGRNWAWFPLYFPALLLLKTSLGILALFGIGAALGLRRARRRWPSPTTLVMIAAPTTFLLVAALSRLNIGVRHALPVVPFMLVVAAAGAVALLGGLGRPGRRWPRALGAGLLAGAGAEAVLSTPAHISHFSWAIGGDGIGHRLHVMGEDWGQDVAELAAVVEREGLGPLYYEAYGDTTAPELAHAGVAFTGFRCGQRIEGPAVIARHLRNVARSAACPPIPQGEAPARVIGHHILLYRVP
ncbi:MAG: glycosyltransferase family 39 protein [Myxococcales bacterium]|nr:glycosyltransferase family 39 protein [Myxococcales bacterium]